MNRRVQAGFTLLEVLLCVVIIGMLVGLSAPIYASFVQHNDQEIATESLVGMLRRAETYARADLSASAWTVQIDLASKQLWLYSGASYSASTPYSEAYAWPADVTLGGTGTMQFAPISATPSSAGGYTYAVGDMANDPTMVVTVNAKGVVSY